MAIFNGKKDIYVEYPFEKHNASQKGSLSGFVARIVGVAAVVISSLVLTACESKGGRGAAVPVPGPVGPSCAQCPAGAGLFLDSAVGKVISSTLGQIEAELALEFFGAGTPAVGSTSVGYLSLGNQIYQGPVAAQGIFTMRIASILCGVPAGVYQVRTLQAGVWGGGGQSFGNLLMEGVGPEQIQIAFGNWAGMVSRAIPAERSLDGRQFPFHLQGLVQVRGPSGYSWCPMIVE